MALSYSSGTTGRPKGRGYVRRVRLDNGETVEADLSWSEAIHDPVDIIGNRWAEMAAELVADDATMRCNHGECRQESVVT